MPAYYARVALEGHETANGRLVVNVLHVETDVLTDPPNWSSIASDMGAWLGQAYQNVLGLQYTFDQIVVTDENYPGSTHGQGVHVMNVAGTRSTLDDHLDPAICAVASFKTAVAKRYGRGHIFLPPARGSSTLGAGAVFDPASTYWGTAGVFLNTYSAGHVAGSTSYIPIVFSKTRVTQGLTPFTFPILGWTMKSQQHFLRSRSTTP